MHTLSSAARATGIAKSAIHRAGSRLAARKLATGFYAIDPVELHRVFPSARPVAATAGGNEHKVFAFPPGTSAERMETRADRYRRLGADDQLRAARTNDPEKRAFEEAAREWLKLADDVEQMERDGLSPSPSPTARRGPR